MDVYTLSHFQQHEDSNTQPVLASRPYISALSWLMRKEEGQHIGHNLQTHYRWNWPEEASLMLDAFVQEGGTVLALKDLVQGILALVPRNPKLVDDLSEPCRIAARLVCDAHYNMKDPASRHMQPSPHRQVKHGFQFYKVLSTGLVPIIEKHVTFLTPEAASTHITHLHQILSCALTLEYPPILELVEQHRKRYPSLPPAYTNLVISMEWKFNTLKKLIVSAQMQLRVLGVTTMCNELLALFQKNKKDDPGRHPLLLHFSDFILENKLVDYIVGIGSHPEIISESSNIIGFLIATKTYTSRETDTIWQTVATSQDPRVVEAIIRMLHAVINLQDYESLLYICQKLGELSLESFTPCMREYCSNIMHLLAKVAGETGQLVDAPPYELCVRLIKESSVPRPDAPIGLLDIQHFASTRLRDLVTNGPSSEIRNAIYVNCIQDISERNSTAPGSICALYGILSQHVDSDLHILTANHGLTRLMIEELEATSNTELNINVLNRLDSPARQARRDLLLAIILHAPDTITPELGRRLWNAFVGLEARTNADREVAWQILNSAASKTSSRNKFIRTCFQEYLPELQPQCYTIGSLDFAREAIQSWLRDLEGDLLDEEQRSNPQGVEQLWHMILTAPPNTIEDPAVNMLVELYIESPMIVSMPRSRAYAVHLKLVKRCLEQLSNAAGKLRAFNDGTTSGDDEPMVIVASDNQVNEQELIFTRSLMLLREFLRCYQAKPQFATVKLRSPAISTAIPEIRGDPIEVKYQAFDGAEQGPVESLTIGKSNTSVELMAFIGKVTGFKGCKIYHWGKEITPDAAGTPKTIESLQIEKGLVLVVRCEEEDAVEGRSTTKSASLRAEIIDHLDEFWDYLGMEERLSREIYYFLIKFPVHQRLIDAFENDTASLADIFPLGQPFKCLYAVYALREHLKEEARDGSINAATLSMSLGLIVSAITNEAILESLTNEDLRSFLAQTLIESLIQILREPILTATLETYLDVKLLHRLLYLLDHTRKSAAAQNSVLMVSSTFEAILDASLYSPPFWAAFIASPSTPNLLYELLLDDPRVSLRKSIMKNITSKCNCTPSLSTLSTIDFASAFWPLLNKLVPRSRYHSDRCDEALSVVLVVFRKLAGTSVDSVDLNACLTAWGGLLAAHKSQETVGYPESIDVLTHGLANLLYWCASFSKASEHTFPPNKLAVTLFTHHLFPELSDTEDDELVVIENVPLLNTTTRKLVADSIVHLTKDDHHQYREILKQLCLLLPFDDSDEGPYSFDLPFSFDRSKSVRSTTGYVGLRNLSNTCYLNSLFTQLFMNISFREFMLNTHVPDGGASQRLLSETQKLFAFMQNSFRRFVDPSNLAQSIRTYDDTNIDVNIQMDVDEFYNLLFDRWEGQIIAPADKRRFRSFYGGQLVQQVKSNECTHISERLEPFSAIQCDIKGKNTLQESLQAYVDGEIMEGDNKYKCSNCDRHVNAVKRACLKDVPDNLIFHLKRFDFNLRTMQRSKINDYFSFPHKIDMRPYKVEHLMDSPEDTPNDIFELVGILVHSGTAESGHYYSYVRERPSYGQYPTWVEFNDDSVSSFDPSNIEATCFGGLDYRGAENGSFTFDKTWSAYMLFYQRSSVLQAQQAELVASTTLRTMRLPIPHELGNFIAGENELLIRKYCLYDESHAPFVLRLFENLRNLNRGPCSKTHDLESAALTTLMLHLDQVVARTKDIPDFANFMLTICHKIKTCWLCAGHFLEWLINHAEAFRQLLFKSPDQIVRSEIASSVILALCKIKHDRPYDYGLFTDVSAGEEDSEEYESQRLFPRTLETLMGFWDTFHLTSRSWPEYFGVLGNMAQLGYHETAASLDAGGLTKILEVLTADMALNPVPQYQRMLAIIQKRPVTKPVSLENAIGLLEILLKACDLRAPAISNYDTRLDLTAFEEPPFPLNEAEYNSLVLHWTRGSINILVEKLLAYNQNPRSTQAIIVIMLNGFDDKYESISKAIRSGIRKVATTTSSVPFLSAALTYCRTSQVMKDIEIMVLHVSNTCRGLDHTEGREYLRFLKDVLDIPHSNPHISSEAFFSFLITQIPLWAPNMLTYYDAVVRTGTELLIEQTLLVHGIHPDLGSSNESLANSEAIVRTVRNLGVSCLRYLHEVHIRPRVQAVKASMQNILSVIESCKPYYPDDGEDDDGLANHFKEYYEG
jgi:ubiquitin carboxyl-terminal hydrolase 34